MPRIMISATAHQWLHPQWQEIGASGVLWERDERLAMPLLSALRAEADLVVGDNQPYPGQYEGDTMWQHGTRPGLPFCSLEIRQDLIRDASGQLAWGERLARIMARVLDDHVTATGT